MHKNSIGIIVHTNTIIIIMHRLIHINISSTVVLGLTRQQLHVLDEWEDPHLGHYLVFSGGHHIQTSHSKQLSLVVLQSLISPRQCCLPFLN
jgi:hypothetical protein